MTHPRQVIRFFVDAVERPVLHRELAALDGRQRILRLCELALLGKVLEQSMAGGHIATTGGVGLMLAPKVGDGTGPASTAATTAADGASTIDAPGGRPLPRMTGLLDAWDEDPT